MCKTPYLSKEAVTKVQAAIISLIIIAAIIGVAWYYVSLHPPSGPSPIKIGILLPLTGSSAFIGQTAKEASIIAVEKINENGGILGRPVEIVVRDTAAEVETGMAAFEKLVHEDKVVAIVGLYRSGVAEAVVDLVAQYKIPTLITGAASLAAMEKVISDYEHYKYLFRPAHINAAQQPVIVIDFLNRYLKPNYGITKVAIIAENTAWTMDYQKTLQEELPKLGFELVYVARPPLDATDYSVELTQAKEKGAQVIIPIISTSSGTILTKQWAELRIPSLLIGTNNIAVRSEFWGETEGKTNYHMVTMWGGNVSITEKTVPFYNEYVKRWGHDPAYMAWNQYDALFILAEAINNCGSTDPDAIVAALEKIDYVGVTGRIQILKNHETRVEVGYRTLLLAQWQDGKLLFVWPEYVQQADIIIPRWMQEAWG